MLNENTYIINGIRISGRSFSQAKRTYKEIVKAKPKPMTPEQEQRARRTQYHATWHPEQAYRRKRNTININGHKVPKPLTEVPDGLRVYTPHLMYSFMYTLYTSRRWAEEAVSRGIAHATSEDAVLHAKALLSFTEESSDE